MSFSKPLKGYIVFLLRFYRPLLRKEQEQHEEDLSLPCVACFRKHFFAFPLGLPSWLERLLLLAAAAWPVDVCDLCARAAAIGAAVAVELRAAGPIAMVPHLARISPNNASPCDAKASSCR